MKISRSACTILAVSLASLLLSGSRLGLISHAMAETAAERRERQRRRERLLERQRQEEQKRAEAIARLRQAAEKNFNDAVDKARQAVGSGDLAKARKLIDSAAKQARILGDYGKVDIEALASEFEDACRKLLETANSNYEAQRYVEAMQGYEQVIRVTQGLPIAKEAGDKLQAMKKDPAVRTALHEAEAAKTYSTVTATIEAQRKKLIERSKPKEQPAKEPGDVDAIAYMSMPNKVNIIKKLQFLKKQYGDTEAGKSAVELLAKLEADEALMEAVRQWEAEEKVRQIFQMGEMYQKAEFYDKAIAQYTQVVKDHPASKYAAKARARLADLKGE